MLGLNRLGSSSALQMLLSAVVYFSLTAQCLAQADQVPLTEQHDRHLKVGKPDLKWEDCGGDANNHTFQCASLEVPMNHFGHPTRHTFTIPLLRLLATNASATGDRHIFFNPGGPGGSGVGFLRARAAQLNKIIGEEFHLLSFDPRGVGKSTPTASCYPSDKQRAASFIDNPWDVEFEAGKMYTSAENKAKACQDMMGKHGKFINTPQTAADMNSILDALGQDKLYYWGFSYGTTLGQTYSQMYPERVGRVVIDGVSNLDDWYNPNTKEEYFTDTDIIFAGFIKECVKHKKDCPLSSIQGTTYESASKLKKYVDEYLLQLEEEPIPVYLNSSVYGSITRQKLVANGIFFALYSPLTWPTLANNLAELLNGNSTPAFMAYSPSRVAQILSDDSNTFVVLNDMKRSGKHAPAHGIHDIRNYTLSLPHRSSLVSKYQASDIFDRASWLIRTTHEFRPQYSHEYPPVKTAHPLLVLSTTYDPVCPLVSAKKAWKSFDGAGFVEQKSYGHCTISMPSLCTAKHVKRYFNEGKVPEEYTTCEIDQEYFVKPDSALSAMSEDDRQLLESLQILAKNDDILFPVRF